MGRISCPPTIVPGGTFHDYVRFISAAFGRYGSGDVIVMLALVRLFQNCVEVLPAGSHRLAVLDQAAATALADAEHSIPRPHRSGTHSVSRHVPTRHDQLAQRAETHVGYLS